MTAVSPESGPRGSAPVGLIPGVGVPLGAETGAGPPTADAGVATGGVAGVCGPLASVRIRWITLAWSVGMRSTDTPGRRAIVAAPSAGSAGVETSADGTGPLVAGGVAGPPCGVAVSPAASCDASTVGTSGPDGPLGALLA